MAAAPALVKLLGSGDPVVQASAAEALGRMESEAVEARPAIEKLLAAREDFVRLHARRALERISR